MSRVDDDRQAARAAERQMEARRNEELQKGKKAAESTTFKKLVGQQQTQAQVQQRQSTEKQHELGKSVIASLLGEAEAQVLAANITHVLAVASVAEPPFQPELVDGILAAALRERIPATLVLSKIDLDHALAAQWAQVYAHAMVRVLATCTVPGHTTQPTLDELARLLHQNNSVVVGLSGAGKSTLLNAVVPGVTLRTGDLNHIRQGRHTTTHTELIPLPGGGHVLDTPGIRNFHLFCTGSQELQFLFPEIALKLPECEYRSCLHDREEKCAVKQALARGEIPQSRYRSYHTMLEGALAAERPGSKSGKTPVRGGGRRRPRG